MSYQRGIDALRGVRPTPRGFAVGNGASQEWGAGVVPLANVWGLDKTSVEFQRALIRTAWALGWEPDWLTPTMAAESGINPVAVNPTSGASGLIQFMPATARALGTSVEALRLMSGVEQLEYVRRYFEPVKSRVHGPGDVYIATFAPAFLGKPRETVISSRDQPIYEANKGFDLNREGFITVDMVASRAENYLIGAKKRVPIMVDMSWGTKQLVTSRQWVPIAAGVGLLGVVALVLARKG